MKSFFEHRRIFAYFFLALFLCFSAQGFVYAQGDDEEEEFSQDEFATSEKSANDPVSIFNRGQEAHSKGDFQTAIELYRQALKVSPKFPEAEFQLGHALESAGERADAEKAFRRALEFHSDWTLAMSALGALLVKKGEFSEAESILQKAVGLDELNFPAYAALAELKIIRGASINEFEDLLSKIRFLTTKPKVPANVWAARAALERKLGQTEPAKTSINKALSIDAENFFARSEKIELAIASGDFQTAIFEARNLSKDAPTLESPLILLARALALSGDSKEAVKVLESRQNPSKDLLAVKNSITAGRDQSIAELESLLAENEKNISALATLCLRSRVENPQKALEYCRRASEIEPANINHAIGFGAALVQLERFADAVGLFRGLLKAAPENYTIRANLATALFQMQDFSGAKTEYIWITQNQPDLAIAYYFLAISHDKLEEYIDALANYQQFLRLADQTQQKLEIEKVNLRLPILQRQIKSGKGKRKEGRK